ncbi:unnamed protein product [Prorocentrum cordatum]|uniref:RRM domain-containing protein n=1 Tax=Prorocentrum cordatum TaxID=2364126 RepID=A0ABN9VLD4_9DINO|nr:unnamed protein product [Polarella glacialis]
MKREKRAAAKGTRRPDDEHEDDEGGEAAPVEPARCQPEKRKRKAAAQAEDGESGDLYQHRVFVRGLPSTTSEKALQKLFGVFGEVRAVRLVRNSRLVFRGSAFVSYGDEDSASSALQLDGGDYKGHTLHVATAEPPKKAPSLRVYVGNVPWEADEKTLRKDFGECGEISKLKMIKDGKRSFKGSLWITYASEEGVGAALAYSGTDYCGRTLVVRRADAMDAPCDAEPEPELEEKALQREVRRARARRGDGGDPAAAAAAGGRSDARAGRGRGRGAGAGSGGARMSPAAQAAEQKVGGATKRFDPTKQARRRGHRAERAGLRGRPMAPPEAQLQGLRAENAQLLAENIWLHAAAAAASGDMASRIVQQGLEVEGFYQERRRVVEEVAGLAAALPAGASAAAAAAGGAARLRAALEEARALLVEQESMLAERLELRRGTELVMRSRESEHLRHVRWGVLRENERLASELQPEDAAAAGTARELRAALGEGRALLAEQEELLRIRQELHGGPDGAAAFGPALAEGARLRAERAALGAERRALLGALGAAPGSAEDALLPAPEPSDCQLDAAVLHVARRCARLRAEVALLQEEGAQLREWLDAAAGPLTTPTQELVPLPAGEEATAPGGADAATAVPARAEPTALALAAPAPARGPAEEAAPLRAAKAVATDVARAMAAEAIAGSVVRAPPPAAQPARPAAAPVPAVAQSSGRAQGGLQQGCQREAEEAHASRGTVQG